MTRDNSNPAHAGTTGVFAPNMSDLASLAQRPVGRIMTCDVATLNPDMRIAQAMSLFIDRGLTAMPVVDKRRRLVGILTESDLMRVLGRGDAQGHPRLLELVRNPDLLSSFALRAEGALVDSVMTRRVATVTDTTTVGDAALLMTGHGVKRLPVLIDCTEQLAGIVSRADIVRALGGRAAVPPPPPVPQSDRALQRAIEAVIGDNTAREWAPGEWVVVSVRQGTARLEGAIGDEGRRRGLVRQVAAVNGVVGVDDRVVSTASFHW